MFFQACIYVNNITNRCLTVQVFISKIKFRKFKIYIFSGLVPKPASEVAQDGEVLGTVHDHGGVRPVRRDGAALLAAAGHHPQEREGERVCRPLAPRYGPG